MGTPQERRVLLLGSSRVTHRDPATGLTLPATLCSRLADLAPALHWRCSGQLLFVGPSMADRARALVLSEEPDALVLDLPSLSYIYQSVLLRVRNRWPPLYSVSKRLARRFRRLGGGGANASQSWRGSVFRLPQVFAVRLLGADSELSPEQALVYMTDMLDALTKFEDLSIVCRLPTAAWPIPGPLRGEAMRRLDFVRARIAEYCDRRRVPYYDLLEGLRQEAITFGLSRDGLHKDGRTTEIEADLIAREVVNELGQTGQRDRPGRAR
jgi:hypothetical protein